MSGVGTSVRFGRCESSRGGQVANSCCTAVVSQAPIASADNDGPRSNLPSRYQSAGHIGIPTGEVLNNRGIRSSKDEQRSVDRVSECTGEDQLALPMGFASQSKMLLPESSPSADEVV